jgi:hypothetical protein
MAFRFPALLSLLAALAMTTAAAAQVADLSPSDRDTIRDVIRGQVDAFRRDDGAAAFGFASPEIQEMFGTPEVFMDMVRQGYRPVYRPRTFDFDAVVTLDGKPTQRVRVIGPDGRPVIAYYPMRRLPDGTWRIDGCYLKAPEDRQV